LKAWTLTPSRKAADAGRPADYDHAKDALDAARRAIRDGRRTLARAGYGTR